MADLETLRDPTQQTAANDRTDLLIAIAAPLSGTALSATAQKLADACRMLPGQYHIALAIPNEAADATHPVVVNGNGSPLRLAKYTLPPTDPAAIPWLANVPAYRAVSSLATQMAVRACTVLGTDLTFNRDSLTPERMILLLDPAVEGTFDLVMPLYTTRPFDDLVNKSILYPLTRTLYGHRVRHPLGNELQMSSRFLPAIRSEFEKDPSRMQGRLLWPSTLAAGQNQKICQVQLGRRRAPGIEGIDLTDALTQLIGPLFLDMEDNAAFWQRIRASRDVPTFGKADTVDTQAEAVDVRRMVEAFQLGERNLRDVWALILPPLTLLELKKLSRQTPDAFQMANSLWARIVYDFALAHRLRNIHRAHLFGAFTPLYLGWVASYAIEINKGGLATAENHVEQLARTFETEKPYLLSRWRWPDRFHP